MTKHRILVVEDEPAIADNIVYALNSEGFEPEWTRTGAAALESFRSTPPALIILDIGLPDTTGFDLCRQIRGESAVPIIFLTARSNEIDRVVGLEIGADDYVIKPFSPRELTARVRARLRRSQPTGVTANPDFVIDEAGYRICLRGADLKLTRYEFGLLKVLLARPGQVFSREQLLERVWENPEETLDRSVDTHIKTLRQKIRLHTGGADPIRTHRGLGYSLTSNAIN